MSAFPEEPESPEVVALEEAARLCDEEAVTNRNLSTGKWSIYHGQWQLAESLARKIRELKAKKIAERGTSKHKVEEDGKDATDFRFETIN